MKIFAATLASVVVGSWEPRTHVDIPDWHNGEYGDLVIQQWQVEHLELRGYLREKMNIDMSTPTTSPNNRGLVTYARLWKDYNGETDEGRYIVPYAIQDSVPAEHWQKIHDELADFTLAMGCVEFVYDPGFSYNVGVHITGENSGGSGCWSYVGVCSGCTNGEPNIHEGWQALRLPNWCVTSGGIHHEFLHAIGYLHEQDRPDYLTYIEDRSDAGGIDPSVWIDTGHPFEPASNVMYGGFTLKNGRSYSPHNLLTTTDAEQGYLLYCDAKQESHPLEPRSMCLHGDHVDVLRPVFQHKFCDGFRDCVNGEDEDGRLAHCGSGDLTERGCCAVINMGFGGATCTASGIVNGKDRYLCVDGWGAELRWTSNYGWFHSVEVGGGSYYTNGDPTHDGDCLGDFGEFESSYTGWNGYDLELTCKPGDGAEITLMPCADHNCSDDHYCQNSEDGASYECICREENGCGTTTTPEPPTTTPEPPTTTPEGTTEGTTPDFTTTSPWSTTTSAHLTCACEPACADGYECFEGTCLDIDECADGSHNCHSFENCRNLDAGRGFLCEPNEAILEECEAMGYSPQWKGRSTTKYVMKGDDTVILASKFRVKNSRVNPRTDLYQGFVTWTKDVCGMDFLKKLRSGEVGVSLVDTNDIYDLNFVYFKNDGRYSMGGFSFELTEVTTMDLPWTWKRGVATKNMGADDVQIVLTGIDKVTFLDAKGMDWCLLTAANALMEAGDYADSMTMCVFENKKFWSAPPNPNL